MKSFRRRRVEGITTPVGTRGAWMGTEGKDKSGKRGGEGEKTEEIQMMREWKINTSEVDKNCSNTKRARKQTVNSKPRWQTWTDLSKTVWGAEPRDRGFPNDSYVFIRKGRSNIFPPQRSAFLLLTAGRAASSDRFSQEAEDWKVKERCVPNM